MKGFGVFLGLLDPVREQEEEKETEEISIEERFPEINVGLMAFSGIYGLPETEVIAAG